MAACGRRQCKRALRTPPLHCRCGAAFCSEPCFIADWHAEHHKLCPNGDEIRRAIDAQRAADSQRSATALLMAAALGRSSRPPGGVPAAATDTAAADSDGAASLEATRDAPATPPQRVLQGRPSDESTAGSAATPAAGSGSKAARYSLEEFMKVGPSLGGGSYGTVSKVVRRGTGEIFALKAVPKQKVLDHQMQDYLLREVKTQIRMQHPNILRLHYYFEDAESVYLLLEYADEGSMFSLMRKEGIIPEHRAARMFIEVAEGLTHLHARGIIHRDLKPENILMCSGVAKLADFGWCAELSLDHAQRHTFCGTWDYLSPEMVLNEPHDFSVDLWALGVLLFELLAGQAPFAAPSQVKAMSRITKVDLQFPACVPTLARDLIGRLLVREPRNRLGLESSRRHPWVVRHIGEVAATREPCSPAEEVVCAGHAASSPSPVSHMPTPTPSTCSDAQARSEAWRAKLAAIEADLARIKDPLPLRALGVRGLASPTPSGTPSGTPAAQGQQALAAHEALGKGPSDSMGGAVCEKKGDSSIASSSQSTDVPALECEGRPRFLSGTPVSDDRAGSGEDARRSKGKELWHETNTFAAVRQWVRQKSENVTAYLGQELDDTLQPAPLPSPRHPASASAPAPPHQRRGSEPVPPAADSPRLPAAEDAWVDVYGEVLPRPKSRARTRRAWTQDSQMQEPTAGPLLGQTSAAAHEEPRAGPLLSRPPPVGQEEARGGPLLNRPPPVGQEAPRAGPILSRPPAAAQEVPGRRPPGHLTVQAWGPEASQLLRGCGAYNDSSEPLTPTFHAY